MHKGNRYTFFTTNEPIIPLFCLKINSISNLNIKHNRLNVRRIALERLVGALINCSLLQSGGGGANGTKKFNSGLKITTLVVIIYHYSDLK